MSTDPDGDDLKYSIEWGDGEEDITGEFASGTPAIASHVWSEKGNYVISAKAIDRYGGESELGELTIKIPKQITTTNSYLQLLIHKFSNFKIFREIFSKPLWWLLS